jgi:hypothetical protein
MYKIGDIVFFSTSNHTVAGEVMYLGQRKDSPGDLVLVIGKQVVEMAAEYCTPTRRGFPAEGESWRRAYLKQRPGSLV